MLKFGNLELEVPFYQASLSGYSNYAMRKLAREFGSPITFAGVMLAKSVANPRVIRQQAFHPHNDEHPVGAQIMDTDPETMVAAAKALEEIGYDILDLNFACPAPKVLRRQRGGYMMQQPELVMDIYRRVRDVVKVPLLMKLRIGYGKGQENTERYWQIIEQAAAENIDGLAIHGRTTLQKYGGKSDWTQIVEAKKRFPHITMVGSGDIFTPEDIVNRLRETGLDGILVARGAVGNPWIFNQAKAMLETGEKPQPPTIEEQARAMLHHLGMLLRSYEPTQTVRFFRKFSCRYAKHHPEKKKVSRDLMVADNLPQFLAAVKTWYGIDFEHGVDR